MAVKAWVWVIHYDILIKVLELSWGYYFDFTATCSTRYENHLTAAITLSLNNNINASNLSPRMIICPSSIYRDGFFFLFQPFDRCINNICCIGCPCLPITACTDSIPRIRLFSSTKSSSKLTKSQIRTKHFENSHFYLILPFMCLINEYRAFLTLTNQ